MQAAALARLCSGRLPSASSASATGTATTRENTSPLAEAVDAVQREQPADVVHILIVQLGQHLVDHALREARLLLQPRAELLVFVRGSGIAAPVVLIGVWCTVSPGVKAAALDRMQHR
jgi:hypothetical protein